MLTTNAYTQQTRCTRIFFGLQAGKYLTIIIPWNMQ